MFKFALAALYNILTALRNTFFDCGVFRTYLAKIPVISVGNLTVGGTGKTPLVSYLTNIFISRGMKPVILMRGYKGIVIGPMLVDTNCSLSQVGDEALLYLSLNPSLPVVVAKSRVEGAKFIEANNLGDLIILDDGFQHRWLKRDCDIVCIDCSSEESIDSFLLGKLLPLGIFRENRERGLKRASAVVLSLRGTNKEEALNLIEKIKGLLPDKLPVFLSYISDARVVNLSSNESLSPQAINLVTGIANPSGVRKLLASLGYTINQHFEFKDHYNFKLADFTKDDCFALPIICTEKDYLRIPQDLKSKFFVIRFSIDVEGGNFNSLFSDVLVNHIKKGSNF